MKLIATICLAVINGFFPVVSQQRANGTTMQAQARAACVMEQSSRRVLYEHQGDTRLPMASTTKIVTAATVLEHCKDIEETFLIPPQAEGVEGSSVYLKSGDSYSIKDLLYGLMLRSGNDCATALALRFADTVADFAVKMNRTAQKAGAVSSRFENPHGLPCKNHYTTARDLSLITSYAMDNPLFCEIVSTKTYTPRNWTNKNKMLYNYEGAIGVKTGYTREAGRCLVSAANREDMTLICTVLGCPTTYETSSQLLDDAFSAYKNVKIVEKEEIFKIQKGKKVKEGKIESELYYPLLAEEIPLIEKQTRPYEGADKKIVGILEIYLAKRLLFSENLYKL